MDHKKVVIRFDESSTCDKYLLRKIWGTATVDSLIRLIDSADLEANPREAKVGNVTDAIQETLETTPDLFHFKSKGLLLAAGDCKALERNRFELSFDNGSLEGVLDGGHNLLAIAIFLLRKSVGEGGEKDIKKIRRWEDLADTWITRRDEVEKLRGKIKFLVPIEVVYPQDSPAGRQNFENAILEVASARNNNSELTEETKANKGGLYEFLRKSIHPDLAKQVEWKTNDGGRIKVRDLIALSWVALSQLDDVVLGKERISGQVTYSSKGACVTSFNRLVARDDISKRSVGDIRELIHPGVKSALALMKDLPRLFDLIYTKFPDAYNSVSPRFGGMSCVRSFDPNKPITHNEGRESKSLRHSPVTKYFKTPCKYDYPEGFIAPLVWALRELIENRDGILQWKVKSPDKFIEENLNETMKVFYGMITMANWDPQVVGKTGACYELMCNDFKGRLPR